MGITTLFNIGRSALNTNQQALTVTGHNVANINTPGFSRQNVELATAVPEQNGGSWFGRGVNIASVQRNFDSFLNGQQNSETTHLGYYDQRSTILKQVEDIFNEVDSGLTDRIQAFFSAWNDVAANPEGRVQRSALLHTAGGLIAQFSTMSDRLFAIQRTYDQSVPQMVDDVNRLIREISNLNTKVVATGGAPDLLDARNQKIMELAEYLPVNRFEDELGRVTVIVGYRTVVDPAGYSEFKAVKNTTTGFYDVIFAPDETPLGLPEGSNGRLKGLLDVRDRDVAGYLEQLDTLAYNLAVQVNALHQTGFGLDGSTGLPFFGDTSGANLFLPPLDAAADVTGAARRLSLLITDERQVAASSTLAGIPGDNGLALSMVNLQEQTLLNDMTFDDFYRSIVSAVGRDSQDAVLGREATTSILSQLEERRQEMSGVNLDEEAMNVIRFQRSYEAAAQIIRTTSELLDVLVNLAR